MRPTLSIILLSGICSLLVLGMSGCGTSQNRVNPATGTAQAQRAVKMATRMANNMEATLQFEQENQRATQQARFDQLETARKWPEILSDTFNEPAYDWAIGKNEDTLATMERDIAGGTYRWRATANQGFVWWVYPQVNSITDLYLETTTRYVEGPETGEIGLIFRVVPDHGYYLFEINGDQQFALFIRYLEEWETLIDWQTSQSIRPAGENRLGVVAMGSQFDFYINDEWVGQGFDDRLEAGKVGLLVGLSDSGDNGVWEFDDFTLRSLEEIPPED